MNFEFFEALSGADAARYLDSFLEAGRQALTVLARDAAVDGIDADLSVASIVPVFEWLVGMGGKVVLAPDMSLPDWIRSTPEYVRNLFDLDDHSKVLALRGAFYLGESFRRQYSSLAWSVGRAETAPQGQPVLVGFTHTMEMPVLLVSENLFARALDRGNPHDDIRAVVKTWESKVEISARG